MFSKRDRESQRETEIETVKERQTETEIEGRERMLNGENAWAEVRAQEVSFLAFYLLVVPT